MSESNNSLICQFCNKRFSTKGSLTTHLKTNKKCALTRNDNIFFLKCDWCEYSTPDKFVLKRHKEKCKHKDKFYEKLEIKYEMVLEERDKLINTISKSKVVINNNSNNTNSNNNNLTFNQKNEMYNVILDDIGELTKHITPLTELFSTKENLLNSRKGISNCINGVLSHIVGKIFYLTNDSNEHAYKENSVVKIDVNQRYLNNLFNPHLLSNVNELVNELNCCYSKKLAQAVLDDDHEEEKLLLEQQENDLKLANKTIEYLKYINDMPSANIVQNRYSTNTKVLKQYKDNPTLLKEELIKTNSPCIIDTPIDDIITAMKLLTTLRSFDEDFIELFFLDIQNYFTYIFTKIIPANNGCHVYYYNEDKDIFCYYQKGQKNNIKIKEKNPDKFYEIFFIHLEQFFSELPLGHQYLSNFGNYKNSQSIREPLIKYFLSKNN